MTKQSLIIIAATAILIFFGWRSLIGSSDQQVTTTQDQQLVAQEAGADRPSEQSQATTDDASQGHENNNPEISTSPAATNSQPPALGMAPNQYIELVRNLLPDYQALKEKMGDNPHGMNPELAQFAADLGQLSRKAMVSLAESEQMLAALDDCVNAADVETFTTVRTTCLANARDISNKYPELADKYQDILRLAPADVSRLLEMLPQ